MAIPASCSSISAIRVSWRAMARFPALFMPPRGMLEFWIDPESPYFKPVFGEDKRFVFFCAGGFRSALTTKTLQDMGLAPVAHIAGGFGAWKAAGGPVEAYPKAADGSQNQDKKG